jgi:glycosyltransferase involved in cell wall biosynthesis
MTAQLLLILIGSIDLVVLVKLLYAFRLLKMREYKLPTDDKLPSVTICIPARNEIHAMTASLDRVVASDYPKLEIIVLDDESRDETSVLIKSYAATGVRFIEGKPLPDDWLGKNYAQSVLAREASGSIVFFMDVDTIIRPKTVSKAVAYMLGEGADMVSIIPQRMDTWRVSVIFATLRHFWTVIRYRARRPRAASNAWLVKRDVLLKQLDGDKTLPMSVQVETTIARTLAPENKYRLILSDTNLGLSYEKKWRSQVETSIRLLYPQCGKQLLQVTGLIGLLSLLILPYFVMFWLWPFGILVIFQFTIYQYYLSKIWAHYSTVGTIFLPYILVQEVALLCISTYKYHFGTITWKNRPITRAVSKLEKV